MTLETLFHHLPDPEPVQYLGLHAYTYGVQILPAPSVCRWSVLIFERSRQEAGRSLPQLFCLSLKTSCLGSSVGR